jgi:hypothetical protein
MSSTDLLRMFARQKQDKPEKLEKDEILKIFQATKEHSEPNETKNDSISGNKILKIFARTKRQVEVSDPSNLPMNFDPRSLFKNSSKRVPENSDVETD